MMKPTNRFAPDIAFKMLGATILIAGILIFSGCTAAESSPDSEVPLPEVETQPTRVINVETAPVLLTDFLDYIHITGEIEALQDVVVSAEEGGVILKFYKRKGSRVVRGQPIVKIKDDLLRSQIDEAAAAADLAQEQYGRQSKLWTENQIGSELAMLQLKSALKMAQARLAMLQTRLANTTIRSPLTGIYDDHYLDAGEMVAPGAPLIRVIDVGQVKAVGGIPERYAAFVHRGDGARITMDGFPGEVFDGTITYVGSAVDPGNRTFPIEVRIENPNLLIKPNMVANLELVKEQLNRVLVVPRQLVQRTEDGEILYIAHEFEGVLRAVARSVNTGPARGDHIVILDGLSPDDQLITLGYQQVTDGSLLRKIASAAQIVTRP